MTAALSHRNHLHHHRPFEAHAASRFLKHIFYLYRLMQGEHGQWCVILFIQHHLLLSRLDHGRAGLVRYDDKHFCDLEAIEIKLPRGYTSQHVITKAQIVSLRYSLSRWRSKFLSSDRASEPLAQVLPAPKFSMATKTVINLPSHSLQPQVLLYLLLPQVPGMHWATPTWPGC